MAQLPPSVVFGSALPGQPVHVLLLIENSLPMVEHWKDLQQHILPGILGAVRIANPGINVQVFWETTGKTEDQRPAYKTQRHFNDFPDIDIVGLPRNKLSPLFIRQSIDLFLSGDKPRTPVTRHLFIVAMSNPIDDPPAKSDHPHQQTQNDDTKWDALAMKLQENNIILHVIANPLERLTRIFDVFRKTMRYQSRQEVIPWQPVDSTHCICHLSASGKYPENFNHSVDQWPEIHLPSAGPPSPVANSPTDMSDDDIPSPLSPIDMINSNPGSLSLVSRMQALHGLASRRRPSERSRRPSISRNSFFREVSPTPSPRRERLVSTKNSQNTNTSDRGAGRDRDRLCQLSMVALSPTLPPTNFSTALDLRGLTQNPPPDRHVPSAHDPYAIHGTSVASGTSPPAVMSHLPPSPGSDGSCSTMSSSLPSISSISRRTTDLSIDGATEPAPSQSTYVSHRPPQPVLYPLEVATSSQSASYQRVLGPTSPTVLSAADVPFPLSPTHFQNSIHAASVQSTYNGLSHPTLPSFATPYPTFVYPQSGIPPYLGGAGAVSPSVPLPPVVEDDYEPEVVPASAPLDERGQVPFIFDPTYEAQNIARLRHAIDSMHETGNTAHSPGASGGTSDLANANWKGHGTTHKSSYIPELPEAFYSAGRERNDDRQAGSYFASSGADVSVRSWDLHLTGSHEVKQYD